MMFVRSRLWTVLVPLSLIPVLVSVSASTSVAGICQLAGALPGVVETTAYPQGNGTGTARKLAVSELTFPLNVEEKSAVSLYRIAFGGAAVWIDPIDFRDGNCVAAVEKDSGQVSKGEPVLGVRGAKQVGR